MFRSLRPAISKELDQLPHRELISECARDRNNSILWAEFLRRYGAKIRQFIRGTWRMPAQGLSGGFEEDDLFQATIVRLVEQDCAALQRFSGTAEAEWLAYLAVITRSVVRDALRHDIRRKRSGEEKGIHLSMPPDNEDADQLQDGSNPSTMEREVLAREVRSLCEQEIHSDEAESCARNLLIFQLYFDHDLTLRQIASCRGINMSKTGVEKVIDRLKDRVRRVVSPDASEAIM